MKLLNPSNNAALSGLKFAILVGNYELLASNLSLFANSFPKY